jgi:hypothetical protein
MPCCSMAPPVSTPSKPPSASMCGHWPETHTA